MKRVWMALALVTLFILVHGTWTFRQNHQRAFAQAVEKKIDIESIHVHAVSGTLVLTGHGSKQQREYAEDIARTFITKYSRQTINPPSRVRNEIELSQVLTGDSKSAPTKSQVESVLDIRRPADATSPN